MISRRFREEVLNTFWGRDVFKVLGFISLASSSELPDYVDTSLDFIGFSGRLRIARISVPVWCTVFGKKPGSSEEGHQYDTDLSITIQKQLELMPNLQRLHLNFTCSIQQGRYHLGLSELMDVMKKAAGTFLEFLYPIQWLGSLEGHVAGRPIRTATI